MSNKTASEIYLEKLQSDFYEDGYTHKIYGTDYNIKNILKDYIPTFNKKSKNIYPEECFNKLKEILDNDNLPTVYEDPAQYYILLNLFEKIEMSAEEISSNLPRRPVVGTLPSGEVNAMAIKVPDSDDFLLVFEDQIFTFANLIAKVVAQSIPFEIKDNVISFSMGKEEVNNYFKNNSIAFERFKELIYAYLFYGEPTAAPQYFLEGIPMHLADRLRTSLELFIVGHEYSHIILGHVQESKTMVNKAKRIEFNEIIFNWDQEFSADVLGLRLMLGCMLKEGSINLPSFVGADLFFGSLDVIEKSISILKTGSVTNTIHRTHPPTLLRREILRKSINEIFGNSKDGIKMAKGVLMYAETLEYILNLLWDSITPFLYSAYKKGYKLDSRWLCFL
jgi:hypothetical protein